LACFHGISRFREYADNFSGHRRNDLLASFDCYRAVPPAAPRAWIGNLSGELLLSGVQSERAVRRRYDANFIGLACEKYGKRVAIYFDAIGFNDLAIQ
jgi:hypothetical protein